MSGKKQQDGPSSRVLGENSGRVGVQPRSGEILRLRPNVLDWECNPCGVRDAPFRIEPTLVFWVLESSCGSRRLCARACWATGRRPPARAGSKVELDTRHRGDYALREAPGSSGGLSCCLASSFGENGLLGLDNPLDATAQAPSVLSSQALHQSVDEGCRGCY